MKFIFASIVLLSIFSCQDVILKDAKIEANQTTEPFREPPPPPLPIKPDFLQGAWTDGSTGNATFAFTKGGIQYVDNLKTYSYSLTGDSIQIQFEDYNYKARINLQNDTLTMSDADGEARFWRYVR